MLQRANQPLPADPGHAPGQARQPPAARADHAALRAKQQRRRRRRRIALPLVGVILVATATLIALAGLHRAAATHPAGGNPAASQLPGLQTGPAPWTANPGGLAARLRAIGLPPLSQMEASNLHTHQHLDLSVDGHRVQVPALVGIDPAVGLAPLHTHYASGVIHVESPLVRTYTLGQFFAVWGVRFSPTCLGGYCTTPTRQLRIYVNGQPYQADPTTLALAPHQEILVAYGTHAEFPHPIPATDRFPPGE